MVATAAALACVLAGGPSLAQQVAGSGSVTDEVAGMLAAMHPDYTEYIGSVRFGDSRLRPEGLYAGLVRRGGGDPRDPGDGPDRGPGVVNDLIVYTDTFEPWSSAAWRRLLADHEYFHARHFARGFTIPLVGFGTAEIDAHYCEALAWGYVVERAAAGAYGDLSRRERLEAEERYREHFTRFHRFVMRRQPTAWAHYGRFLPEPDGRLTSAESVPRATSSPAAGRETARAIP